MGNLDDLALAKVESREENSLARSYYKLMTDKNFLDFFAVNNSVVKRKAMKRLREIIKSENFSERVIQNLNSNPEGREGLLTALSYLQIPRDKELFYEVKSRLHNEDKKVKISSNCFCCL